MKYLIIGLCVLITSCGPHTLLPAENFKTEILVNNLNRPKNQLYIEANTWLVDNFKNPESVIEFTDKESGVILGKYLLQGSYLGEFDTRIDTRIFCKIDIRVKDHNAKIKIIPISDLNIHNTTAEASIKHQIKELALNFQTHIKNPKEVW